MKEPIITMNGLMLTESEAMTVRVAVESFSMSLHHEGLGDDEVGESLTKAYMMNIDRIRTKMYNKD